MYLILTCAVTIIYRMCIWETIALKRTLQQDWNDPNPKAKRSTNVALVPGTVDDNYEEPAAEVKESTEKATPKTDMFSPAAINTKYFKFVLTQTPHYITPLYQGIVTFARFIQREIMHHEALQNILFTVLTSKLAVVGITKMLFHRRDVDAVQRGSSFKIAGSLSRVLQSHISWTRPGKYFMLHKRTLSRYRLQNTRENTTDIRPFCMSIL